MNCLKVPRLFLPRRDFETWACPDAESGDRAYWSEVERIAGASVSAVHFYPNLLSGPRPDEEVRESMYRLLEKEEFDRLGRCFVLTERTTRDGVRHGLVVSVDLEDYTFAEGQISPIRPAHVQTGGDFPREGLPLEFPLTVLCCRGWRGDLVKTLLSYDPEVLYDFSLMADGGRIKGYYIGEELAYECLRELVSWARLQYIAVQGEKELTAAKLHWEKVKQSLGREERYSHPARFALAELINLEEKGVVFHAVNRVVEDVEPDVLCDFLMRNLKKCTREGNTLEVKLSYRHAAERTDALLREFLRQNGGRVRYVASRKLAKAQQGGESVAILLPALPKEKLFSCVKDGRGLPPHTFSFCPEGQGRFRLEGREISYD